MRTLDRSFTDDMKGSDLRDSKGTKVGKVLAMQYNCGTALIDLPRIYKNGVNEKYFIGDKRTILWQPPWLQLIQMQEEEQESDTEPANTPDKQTV